MNVKIHYGHIGRTESLESYIQERLEKLAEKFSLRESSTFEVFVEGEHQVPDGLPSMFKTSIILSRPHKTNVVAQKSDKNFYRAFTTATAAIQTMLRKEHSQKKKDRSHYGHSAAV